MDRTNGETRQDKFHSKLGINTQLTYKEVIQTALLMVIINHSKILYLFYPVILNFYLYVETGG